MDQRLGFPKTTIGANSKYTQTTPNYTFKCWENSNPQLPRFHLPNYADEDLQLTDVSLL